MVNLRKLFTPVTSMTAEEAREFVANHEEGSYTLLDVRQPREYEESHIPGSKLIPLPELADSLDQLDKNKPTLVYCAIGGRSRVAAQLLAGQGFEETINLKGGIKAWQGQTAEGPEELGMDLISEEESAEGVLRLAYGMENTLGTFYRDAAGKTDDAEVAGLLEKLASIEDRHKNRLLEVYRTIDPAGVDEAEMEKQASDRLMEGGFEIEDFTRKYEPYTKKRDELLDLSMMLETQALDLYLRFAESVDNENSKSLLYQIADEEKAHLAALGKLR